MSVGNKESPFRAPRSSKGVYALPVEQLLMSASTWQQGWFECSVFADMPELSEAALKQYVG